MIYKHVNIFVCVCAVFDMGFSAFSKLKQQLDLRAAAVFNTSYNDRNLIASTLH